MLSKKTRLASLAAIAAFSLSITACGGGSPAPEGGTGETSGLEGNVTVDGSSTVFPISEAMAEEFMKANPGVKVTVGVSGSGGGFKKFCAGETDISNASRPIKESEMKLCADAGIEYVEVPVAFDGLSVVVNPENDWAVCLKPEELGKMWEFAAEGKVTKWSQVRSDFPGEDLKLYGPGTDSGTYDYFVEALIEDEDKGSRGDYTASEDDNVIVQGVQADEGGLGFFGFAYYEENKDALKIVEIENAEGNCVIPSTATVADGSYNPLARPIFFYVKTSAMEEKPQVKAFVEYQIDAANSALIEEVGYVALPGDIATKVVARVANATTGSIFGGKSSVGVPLAEKL